MKIVAAPKVVVQSVDNEQKPGANCWGCNALLCVPD